MPNTFVGDGRLVIADADTRTEAMTSGAWIACVNPEELQL